MVITGGVVLIVAIGLILFISLTQKPEAPTQVATENDSSAGEDSVPVAAQAESAKSTQLNVARRRPGNNSETAPEPTSSIRQPLASAQSQQALAHLVQNSDNPRTLTAQGAAEWKDNLSLLVSQGEIALPEIRDFLAKNQDVAFDAPSSRALLGYSTLRAGLFDALAQIGGESALTLLIETLHSTADPADIAALAHILETQAPGQFRQAAIDVARETLQEVARGTVNVTDVGPLFQVLQNYGDANVASEIGTLSSKWPYYSTVALAQLPDGAGIPTLVEQLQKSELTGESRNLNLRMLSQLGAQYPAAAAALLEQARQNQIPERAWRQIATGLAGDQFMLALDPSLTVPGMPTVPGLKTYHMQQGNENFVSLPVGDNGMVSQRLDLIGQLLTATANPSAATALQTARDTLVARKLGPERE